MSFLKIAGFFFLLLIVSLPLLQPPVFRAGGLEIRIPEILFSFSALALLIAILRREAAFRFHKIYFVLALYFTTLLASAFFSEDPKQSFYKMVGVAYLIGLTVLTINIVTDYQILKKTFKAWTIGTIIVICVGLMTFALFYLDKSYFLLHYTLSIYGAVPVGNYPRVQSTLISAALLGNYLTVSLVISLILIYLRYQTSFSKSAGFYIYSGIIIFVAVSGISTVIGGLFLAGGFWIFYLSREKNILISRLSVTGGLLCAVFFFLINIFALVPHPTANYKIIVPGTEFSVYPSSRLMVWTESTRTFLSNFFFGRGIGLPSCRVLYLNTDGFYSLLTDAHNIYLSLASQAGIFGLIGLLFICYFGSRNFIRGLQGKNNISALKFGLSLAFFCAFVYEGIFASFEDARHIWILLGLIAALDNFEVTQSQTDSRKENLSELLQKSDIVLEH